MSRSLIWLTSLAACQDLPPFVSPDDVAASPNPPLVEAPWRVERVQQSVPEQVDVLWVIDNSGSMADEQAALIGAFPSFIRYFADSGLDWHIGVVTTDADAPGEGGKLQGAAGLRYLEPDAPDPIQTFAAMARVGTDGSSDEQGRRVAWLALTTPLVDGYNHGFYREDASLHVIVISDEPDATVEPRLNEFVACRAAPPAVCGEAIDVPDSVA